MKPPDTPQDVTQPSIDTGHHLDIVESALARMGRDEARETIERMVNVVANGVRTPFAEWLDQRFPKNEPPKTPEPDALVHKEIYDFSDGIPASPAQRKPDATPTARPVFGARTRAELDAILARHSPEATAERWAKARIIPRDKGALKDLLDAVADADPYEFINGQTVIVTKPQRRPDKIKPISKPPQDTDSD